MFWPFRAGRSWNGPSRQAADQAAREGATLAAQRRRRDDVERRPEPLGEAARVARLDRQAAVADGDRLVGRLHRRERILSAMPTPYRSPWATDEHELFRATVRDFAARELLPHEERFIAQGHVDPEVWTRAGAAGLLGCDIPAEHGGLGGDFGHECVVYEEVWRTGFSGFGKAVHEIAAHYVLDYATAEQRARWLPRMVAGELVGAIAMSEPGAGSDLRGSPPARSATATTSSSTARRRSSRTACSRT